MRKRVSVIFLLLFLLTLAVTLGLFFTSGKNSGNEKQDELVRINEIDKLIQDGRTEEASEKLSECLRS